MGENFQCVGCGLYCTHAESILSECFRNRCLCHACLKRITNMRALEGYFENGERIPPIGTYKYITGWDDYATS